jgi:hypothetical protein
MRRLLLLAQLSCAFAAIAVSPHSLKMHHEWDKAVAANEWSRWQKAFDRADQNRDGMIKIADVHTVFVEHHNLAHDSEEVHPAGGAADHDDYEGEFRNFQRHCTEAGRSDNELISFSEFRRLMEGNMAALAEQRGALLQHSKHIF